MRVPVRADGSALLLWVAAALGAGGLSWWDAQDTRDARDAPSVPAAPTDDLVWMDTAEAADAWGLGPAEATPTSVESDPARAPSGRTPDDRHRTNRAE